MAEELGVHLVTYRNWETGRTEPEAQLYPGVIRFLGYDPAPEPRSLAERTVAARRRADGAAGRVGVRV